MRGLTSCHQALAIQLGRNSDRAPYELPTCDASIQMRHMWALANIWRFCFFL